MLSKPSVIKLIATESVSQEAVDTAQEIMEQVAIPVECIGADEGILYLFWKAGKYILDCEIEADNAEWWYTNRSGTSWIVDHHAPLPQKVRNVLPYFGRLSELHPEMEKCLQTKGQNVLQHGESVVEHYQLAVASLRSGCHPEGWRIPKWFDQFDQNIVENLHRDEIAIEYLLYHDCGKPRCRTVNWQLQVHFPDHAAVSKKVFLEYGGNPVAAELVGHDMVIHTASAEEIGKFCEVWTPEDAMTLLLAALSEVHSNAIMFGGVDSVSFKSKFKTIERRGNQICKHYFA